MKLKAMFNQLDDNKIDIYYTFHKRFYHFATVHIDEMPDSIMNEIAEHPHVTDLKLELDN